MKIEAAVRNARAFLAIQDEFGSFDAYCLAVRRWAAPCESVEGDEGDGATVVTNILRIAGGRVRLNTRSEGNVGSPAVWMI